MNKIQALLSYCQFYLRASTRHDIHSPFVFDLMTKMMDIREEEGLYSGIERLRKQLLKSNEMIEVTDFGAGSRRMKGKKRKIKDIARNTSIRPKYGRLLFHLNHQFGHGNVLELGTSLGISSLYLKWGNSKSTLTSLEGCPEVAAKARHHFKLLDQEDIAVYTGDFSTTLPHYLSSIKELDLVFFDGNHQLKPTLDYFYACLEKAHDGTVFIFDDIHWSPGMLAAWEEIKNNKRVTVSLDLYFMGLVFFRNGQEKQHFNLRY